MNKSQLLFPHLSGALSIFVMLVSCPHSIVATDSNLHDESLQFVEMFNGEDLAGWGGKGETEVNGYAWEDGMLQSTPKSRNLMTDKEFSNYILEFEFQLTPGANNGLGIHYPGEGNPAYAGMEIQILDGEHEKYKGKLKDYQHHGSLYSLAPAKRGYLKPVGKWNVQRVTVRGPLVTVQLNGTRILEANLDELSEKHPEHKGVKHRKGKIAFCGHGNVIRVRNMRIAELALSTASASEEAIKAYCLDFNWAPTHRRGRPFAKPGQWAGANPAEHVAWYEAMGANVIQTFAVSTNGYAWYKNGFIPEQPGLKHDFLPEVVRLGHEKGLKVFGYFCAASNPRWAELHPEQSYGNPSTYHIPYTDDYLEYLSKSIYDAVSKTGMDGFMVDWLWMPKRESSDGKWIESEKQLFQQLMREDFPGEDKLSEAQDLAYSRIAIARCWEAIRKAAKSANPDCIIWLTVNKMHHPHVVNSKMYQEVDWLMNEAGHVSEVLEAREMVGEHTQLITCLAAWNGVDAAKTVPEAIEHGIGLYGFTTPLTKNGIVELKPIFEKQVTELSEDKKNIAMLARAYRGKSAHARWKDGQFVEPEDPRPFRLTFQRRGRGLQDTAHLDWGDDDKVLITVRTPNDHGQGYLEKLGEAWPDSVVVQLEKKPGQAPKETTLFSVMDGETGVILPLDGSGPAQTGKVDPEAKIHFSKHIKFALKDDTAAIQVPYEKNDEFIRVTLPNRFLQAETKSISFHWGNN